MKRHIDLAMGFLIDIRLGFFACDVRPIFHVIKNNNTYHLKHVKRISVKGSPRIDYCRITDKTLLDLKFQKALNSLLDIDPIKLNGIDDFYFVLPSGQKAIIPRVKWQIEIYRFKRLNRDREGSVEVEDFLFKDKPLDIKVSY